ncbi:MAG: hypothetical protein ABIJ42_06630 [Acidobacteriota bacterium]
MNIHIGMTKTGSTSLQRFLFANREVLRTQGVSYLDNDEFMFWDAHHRLAQSFLPGHDWKALLEFAGGKDDPATMVSILREELAGSGSRNFVISSELFAVEDAEKVSSGLEDIRELYDIRILVYIRNYPDFLESLLAHHITFDGYDNEKVTEEFKRNFCMGLKGHYSKVIDSYARHFGRKNIEVRVLEKEQLHGGEIIFDFLAFLGLEKDGSYRDPGMKNISLRRNGLEYLMFLNRKSKESPVDPMNNRVVREILKKLPDSETCSLFNSGLRSEIVSWTEPECRYLAREYLGCEDGVLFTKPGGKDIPGGESYRGLDPEYAVNVSLAIMDRVSGQGDFSGLNLTEGKPKEQRTTAGRVLEYLCLRVPGSRMIRDLMKRQG